MFSWNRVYPLILNEDSEFLSSLVSILRESQDHRFHSDAQVEDHKVQYVADMLIPLAELVYGVEYPDKQFSRVDLFVFFIQHDGYKLEFRYCYFEQAEVVVDLLGKVDEVGVCDTADTFPCFVFADLVRFCTMARDLHTSLRGIFEEFVDKGYSVNLLKAQSNLVLGEMAEKSI